ncbi:MAG: hypothetical protein JOY71_15760 [Acetobacteraceae bacterium]|nr:hypothetical protein [Acetobacteraceae bacterium]
MTSSGSGEGGECSINPAFRALRRRRDPVADIRLNGAWGTVYVFQDKADPLVIKFRMMHAL